MILYAAFKCGAITWEWIHDLYVNQPIGEWVSRMTAAGTTEYHPKRSHLKRGDLVFFDGLAHVALATGSRDEIFTFWPPPDTKFTGSSGTVDRVKTSRISTLAKWMKKHVSKPTVTFGSPAW